MGLDDIPSRAGKQPLRCLMQYGEEKSKILWIVCTNPAQSMPDQQLIREALERQNSSSYKKPIVAPRPWPTPMWCFLLRHGEKSRAP